MRGMTPRKSSQRDGKPSAHRSWLPRTGRSLGAVRTAIAVVLVALLIVPAPIATSAAAQSSARIGTSVFTAIGAAAAWAIENVSDPDCSLTANQVTALVLAPIWAETVGNDLSITPSPMTLGRYDTEPDLYPFARPDGIASDGGPVAGLGAFWHTSIGLWQLDSSGSFRSMNAGERIDASIAARRVAKSIAVSWCYNERFGFATIGNVFWAWNACASRVCVETYEFLYDSETDSLRNLILDDTQSGTGGGIEWRTCSLWFGSTEPCAYIDPAQAEGATSFTADGFGPAPLTAPFYALSVQTPDGVNFELRAWLAADTGSNENIFATRSSSASAHEHGEIDWVVAGGLCDVSTGSGDCQPECESLGATMWVVDASFPVVLGSDGDDVIVGTDGDDVLDGGPGDDVICAGEGADLVNGGDGDDLVLGGGGDDQIWGQAGADTIYGQGGSDKMRGGDGRDLLRGGDGADDINGGKGSDMIFGEGGDDTALRGGTGDDTVDGGPGNDVLVSGNGGTDVVLGGDGDDKLVGGPRPDQISGGPGNDFLRGLGGADVMAGGPGDDQLFGGEQPDQLDGGEGIDSCNGGSEADTATNCETSTNLP